MNVILEEYFIPINKIIEQNFSSKKLSDNRLKKIKSELKKKLPIIMLGGEPHLDLVSYIIQSQKKIDASENSILNNVSKYGMSKLR
jgi:hypothetical protein